jgi:hypothetical protein
MANIKISELVSGFPATTLDGTEGLPGVQSGGKVGITTQQIKDFIPTLYTANGTLSGNRVVIIPDAGSLLFGTNDEHISLNMGGGGDGVIDTYGGIRITNTSPTITMQQDANNYMVLQDDSGYYMQFRVAGNTIFQANALEFDIYVPTLINEILGARRPVSEQPSDFTPGAISRTLYTNVGASGTVTTLLTNDEVGTERQFYCTEPFEFWISADTGLTLDFYDTFGDSTFHQVSTDTATYIKLLQGQSCHVCKISATQWAVTSNNGGVFYAD